jgi:serine/threonine protein kinase
MDYLHNNKMYHLHLSSKNIYLADDYTPMVADYGFHYLKDISSVFIKYKNKNSYTSPELLKENTFIGNSSLNTDNFLKSDIYSFGILLWELYTVMLPFNINLNNLFNYVVVNGYRPEITKDFDLGIAELIRACWDTESIKRPSFKHIIEIIERELKI